MKLLRFVDVLRSGSHCKGAVLTEDGVCLGQSLTELFVFKELTHVLTERQLTLLPF